MNKSHQQRAREMARFRSAGEALVRCKRSSDRLWALTRTYIVSTGCPCALVQRAVAGEVA